MPYVKCCISDYSIVSDMGVKSKDIYMIDSDTDLYAIVFQNGVTLLLASYMWTEVGDGEHVRRYFDLFDKPFSAVYRWFLDVVFTCIRHDNDSYTFLVESESTCNTERVGELKIYVDGRVEVDGDEVDTRDLRRMYSKAMLLK